MPRGPNHSQRNVQLTFQVLSNREIHLFEWHCMVGSCNIYQIVKAAKINFYQEDMRLTLSDNPRIEHHVYGLYTSDCTMWKEEEFEGIVIVQVPPD